MHNHKSAHPNGPLYAEATKQIQNEIDNGNYIKTNKKPCIVSPIGVIPKSDGGVRLIHNCSRPLGQAVNDYVSGFDKQSFQTLDSAKALMTQECFMAKIDLKAAYRSVNISQHSQSVTGLKWKLDGSIQYLYDSKIPFGSRLGPGIFNRLTQAVRRMAERRGFSIVAYIDDFFLCEKTHERCQEAMNFLVNLLRELGFQISWSKMAGPSQTLTFLGVELDSVHMEMRLPQEKLVALRAELDQFARRKRVSKRQLQSLAGKLSWAATAVIGGRVFLRRIIDAFCTLRNGDHKMYMRGDILYDVNWWRVGLSAFNGVAMLLDDDSPPAVIYTDACNDGGGGHWGDDWFYCNWDIDLPHVSSLHINQKEILSVLIGAQRWGHLWCNQRVFAYSDNSVTVACVNKGSSRNPFIMECIRKLFWLSVKYNFRLSCRHIPGEYNVRADTISRLTE
ncbi:uncharacterized protein, partial [Argopecten irradians]|uniref:uncharacterized protein n=1 Tax=Argopecten irradians TaxID=31199 RepID=UPI00371AAE27